MRAKNDRMSGRKLFLSDANWFVDDADAYEKYQREEESDAIEQKGRDISGLKGPNTSTTDRNGIEVLAEDNNDDGDDELDIDELEASLSRTSIQIREPGIEASS